MSVRKLKDFHDDFENIIRLGEGAEGLVMLCHNLRSRRYVALKKIECVGVERLTFLENSVKKLIKMPRHKHLVTHHDYYIQDVLNRDVYKARKVDLPNVNSGKIALEFNSNEQNKRYQICLEMEFCNAGTLEYILRKPGDIQQKHVMIWIQQICLGLFELHKTHTIHRDIKPQNIFFHDQTIGDDTGISSKWDDRRAEDFIIKIGDLGLLKKMDSELAQTRVGTMYYMSPEVLNDEGHDTSADIWSLGIIVLMLMVTLRNQNLNYDSNMELIRKMRKGLLSNQNLSNLDLRLDLYKKFIPYFHPKLCSIMFETLNHSPEQRPTAKEILNFIGNKKKYMRVNPLTVDNWEDVFVTTKLTNGNGISHLEVIKNKKAKNFWQGFFGEKIFRSDWRSFIGAYQSRYKRLQISAQRGLKKLLCGHNSGVVTIFHFAECVKRVGFPFAIRVLEKVEKFGVPIGSSEVLDDAQLSMIEESKEKNPQKPESPNSEEESEESNLITTGDNGEELYYLCITQYDNYCRDIVSQYVDTLRDCVLLIDIEPIVSEPGLRMIIRGPPFSGKTVLLKQLMYHYMVRSKKKKKMKKLKIKEKKILMMKILPVNHHLVKI